MGSVICSLLFIFIFTSHTSSRFTFISKGSV